MIGQVLRKLFKKVIVVFVAASVVSTVPLKLEKRSTPEDEFSGPCFVLSGDSPNSSESTKLSLDSLTDLEARTSGLIMDASLLKDFFKTHYGLNDVTAEYLDMMNWMNEEKMLATDEQKEAAITKPKESLKAHFHLLAENKLYINQTRKVGPIGNKTSEETTRQKLKDFEMKLMNCMCSIKIALRSAGSDVNSTVSTDILNASFLALSSPLENATYRAYVTIQDSLELVKFLNTIYKEIALSLDDTEA